MNTTTITNPLQNTFHQILLLFFVMELIILNIFTIVYLMVFTSQERTSTLMALLPFSVTSFLMTFILVSRHFTIATPSLLLSSSKSYCPFYSCLHDYDGLPAYWISRLPPNYTTLLQLRLWTDDHGIQTGWIRNANHIHLPSDYGPLTTV